MEIVSIRDKRVKALAENPTLTKVRGFTDQETRKVIEMLSAIRIMSHPLQLLSVPSWKAHELVPGQPNKWSLTVNRNYRLTFFVNLTRQEVSIMDYEDYH